MSVFCLQIIRATYHLSKRDNCCKRERGKTFINEVKREDLRKTAILLCTE